MPNFRLGLQLRLVQQLQLGAPQQNALAKVRAAKDRLRIPYGDAKAASRISQYRDILAQRLQEVGELLIGQSLSPDTFLRPHFGEVVSIFLTLQAGWSSKNELGIELIKNALAAYIDRGTIKGLKYGGTPETVAQLQVARALIEKASPGRSKEYLTAWQQDLAGEGYWTTDELYEWLTMGKVCGGSCQAFDGNPEHNKSLAGYILGLDKLCFTGQHMIKTGRALLVPTPVVINGQTEWVVVIPAIYQTNNHDRQEKIAGLLTAGLTAAGRAGATRLVLLGNRYSLAELAAAHSAIAPDGIVIEIKDAMDSTVRQERITVTNLAEQEIAVLALAGPNRFKYWDNAGGMIDFYKTADKKPRADIDIAGVKIRGIILEQRAAQVIDISRSLSS